VPVRDPVRLIAGALAVLVLTGGCLRSSTKDEPAGDSGWTDSHKGRSGLGDVPATRLGFTRHADAVDFPATGDFVPPGAGLRMLLPVAHCARGIGDYQNGYRAVTVNWTGADRCEALRFDPAPDGASRGGDGPPAATEGWRGGGISADAAVVEPDGAILTADPAGLVRHRPDGTTQELARADLSTVGFEGQGSRSLVRGLARTRSGRIIVNAGQGRPSVLVSGDHGRTLRKVDLPQPPSGAREVAVGGLAADRETVVALGAGQISTAAWRSRDGGRTWSVSRVGGMPPNMLMTRLVHARSGWIALAGVDHEEPGRHDTTLVLRSEDGLHWTTGSMDGLGAGRVTDVTVGQDDDLVMIGAIDDPRQQDLTKQRQEYCGVVWRGDGVRRWERGELGCSTAPPQAVTTLNDGRTLIAGNRDLWITSAGGVS
jgi:hypothetical protein